MPKEIVEFQEAGRVLSSLRRSLSAALNAQFKIVDSTTGSYSSSYLWVEDVVLSGENTGSVIIEKKSELWSIGYIENDDGSFTFDSIEDWVHVYKYYKPFEENSSSTENEPEESDDAIEVEEAELSEMEFGEAIDIIESEDSDTPLKVRIAVIKPGWGNTRDNYYYPRDVIKENAHVFNGLKMYATNHKPSEKNVLTEVSEVLACPVGFTEEGAPIAEVGILNSDFEEMIRRRKKFGILKNLHCSIVAGGKAIPNFQEGGRRGKKVTSITNGVSIDWVTNAGAGGQALELAEFQENQPENDMKNVHDDVVKIEETEELEDVTFSENEDGNSTDSDADSSQEDAPEEDASTQENEEVFLTEAEIVPVLDGVNLPKVSIQKLKEGQYHNVHEVATAILSEQKYVAQLTGSGTPPMNITGNGVDMKEDSGNGSEAVTMKEVGELKDSINEKYLG